MSHGKIRDTLNIKPGGNGCEAARTIRSLGRVKWPGGEVDGKEIKHTLDGVTKGSLGIPVDDKGDELRLCRCHGRTAKKKFVYVLTKVTMEGDSSTETESSRRRRLPH